MHGVKVDLRDLEIEQLKLLLNAGEYQSALDDIYNYCRNILKHGVHDDNENLIKAVEHIKNRIPDIWD